MAWKGTVRSSLRRYLTVLIAAAILLVAGASLTRSQPPQSNSGAHASTPGAGDANGDAMPPVGSINVRPLESGNAGAAQLTLVVDAPRGTRFYVAYRNIGVRGASNNNSVWQIAEDEPAELKISLQYRPDFTGDRTVSVLKSGEKNLDYRVEAQGCTQPGIATIASAPLMTVPAEERAIVLPAATDLPLAVDSEQHVLVVAKKTHAENARQAANPRSEIVIGLYREPPKFQASAAQRLTGHWLRQPQEVGSAHIKYRQLSVGDLQALSRDAVNAILAEAELDDHPERFPAAARKLIDRPEIADKPWGEGEFFSIGLKTRDNTSWYARVFDGEIDLYHGFANNQIDVYHRNESRNHRKTLAEFRVLGSPATDLTMYEIKELPNGRVVLRHESPNASNEMLVDLATGFLRHTLADLRAGAQVNEAFQYAATTYPGGIVLPKLIVRTGYFKGDLIRLEMLMLDTVELNEGVPRDTFKLAAKKGANVLIHGSDPITRADYLQVSEDTADVAGIVREHEQKKADESAK